LAVIQSDGGGRSKSPSGYPMLVLAAASAVLAAVFVWTLWQVFSVADRRSSTQGERTSAWPLTPWKNAQPHVKYVGDSTCARCHSEIAQTFRHHPMGRSVAPVFGGDEKSNRTSTFESGSSVYTVERQNGHVVHREDRRDQEGRIVAQVEGEVKYALGSGTRGISYLIERDGRLFQSPISWYSQKNRWDISPGYDQSDAHFDRPVVPGCLFCHANRVEPVAHTLNRYELPISHGEAIGCERCHGPGELHARRPEVVDGRDLTIVNPQHLKPALRDAVCEQCHLQGDQRIERLDRTMFDYRPALPLIEFLAVFGRSDQQETKFVGQVEQMKQSRCFRESQGRLGCISCHDPHEVPPANERVERFRRRCLECHEETGCKLPVAVRLAESAEDSCIQCHMQTLKKTEILHTATTDHRILRTPESDSAGLPQVVAGLPLVLLNGGELTPNERKSLERELAIAIAMEGPRLPDSPQVRETGALVLSFLDKALQMRPDDLAALRMKAQTLALSGRKEEALRVIRGALNLAPTDEQALEEYLSYAVNAQVIVGAVEPARRAVSANPWSSVFHERLAYFSLGRQDFAETLRESRAALRLNPFLRFARMFLVQSLLHEHNPQAAAQEFATLVKLNPSLRESLLQWFEEQKRTFKF
jgi:tetratricopeptide (TPR) repeat protein